MKSMVVSKLKALISDEVNKQLAENYQELLSRLIKIDVENIEEDMSYAVGAAYYMIGGRLIFTPIIYRDGQVDSISFIGDVENDKLYGLTKKMYKKITSVIAMDFGEVMSKKNEERASVDSGIIGHLFATPRTYSPKTASDVPDAVIVAALENDVFRENFTKMMNNSYYSSAIEGVYGNEIMDRANDLDSFAKIASIDVPKVANKRRYNSIPELKYLPMEKRASAALEIAKNGFYEDGVELTKVAAVSIPSFGEQIVTSSGSTVIAKDTGAYNFISRDYKLIQGFIAQDGLAGKKMLFTGIGSTYIDADRWGDRQSSADSGYIAIPTSFFPTPSESIKTTMDTLVKKTKSAKSESYVIPRNNDNRCTIFVSPNSEEIYFFSSDGDPVSIGNKKVYTIDNYDSSRLELVIDPDCSRMIKSETRIICNPSMATEVKGHMYAKLKSDIEGTLMRSYDLDRPIVKTAEFEIKYSAGSYYLDGEAMPKDEFTDALVGRGFNKIAANEIASVANKNSGSDVIMSEMTQTLKAILSEITENKHTTKQLLELMSSAQDQAAKDGTAQGDGNDTEVEQQIIELASQVGGDGSSMVSQAREAGVPLTEILAQLQQYISQQQYNQPQQDQEQVDQLAEGQDAEGQAVEGQAVEGQDQQMEGQDTQNGTYQKALINDGFAQTITPEMIIQLKEISDKDVFNAAIISYFVDANNAGDIIKGYIEEIDGGVVAMAKVMLFIDTQKEKMSKTVGEKQLSIFINRGKGILNRMTDFVIDAALIQ